MTGAPRYLVTGGAGFIGANLADRLLARGEHVLLLDALSRPGSGANLAWLRSRHGQVPHLQADVADAKAVAEAVAAADIVYHLAGQTAVTTSVVGPREDFEANALGTLNVLEAARASAHGPAVL